MSKFKVISQKSSKYWIFGQNGHFLTVFGQKWAKMIFFFQKYVWSIFYILKGLYNCTRKINDIPLRTNKRTDVRTYERTDNSETLEKDMRQ